MVASVSTSWRTVQPRTGTTLVQLYYKVVGRCGLQSDRWPNHAQYSCIANPSALDARSPPDANNSHTISSKSSWSAHYIANTVHREHHRFGAALQVRR